MPLHQRVGQVSASKRAQRAGVVLIVDDDSLVGEMMYRAISRGGLAALLAASPAEAMTLAADLPIALLVTDFRMPSMTGLELAARIRGLHPGLPVILVSGTPAAGRLHIEPPAAFLAKPFSLDHLAASAASLAAMPAPDA